jgi:hypothetical protein
MGKTLLELKRHLVYMSNSDRVAALPHLEQIKFLHIN